MSQNNSHTASEIAKVDGWPINLATLPDTINAVIDATQNGESFSVVTLNVDHLVKLRHSAKFQNAYKAAKFVTADGAPVAWLARRSNSSVRRTTGADLVVPLAKAAANANIPLYLFGTSDDVLGKAGAYLAAHTNGALNIVGSASPPRDFDPESKEADAALDAIADSGAKLCFLALGAPKQEILAARAVERGIKVGFVSIGAALDFLAGAQIRAPKFLQDHGLEWTWRLVTNPMRLAPRYASCAVVMADILMHEVRDWARRDLSGRSAA